MNFASVRVITNDVTRLIEFYEQVTGLEARWATDEFAEIITSGSTLAFASARTIELLGAGAAIPAQNRTVILEFRVKDVDRECERIADVVGEFVLEPTTLPWGNRSMLFRDPDGNLINFYAPVTEEAIQRFDG